MVNMKGDMAGAASVIAATFAIARLGLPISVTAFAPMAENMVSSTSTRPGDVITMHNGTTVEIANTDAEGRMLLGDALSLAVQEKPDVVVDIATLTGHMQIALGDKVGAVMGTDDQVQAVLAAGVARRRAALADADPRGDVGADHQPPRSPTCSSTTGCAGAAASTPPRSCASSPTACRGRTSTSPARRSTPAAPTATCPRARPASASRTLVAFARSMAAAE